MKKSVSIILVVAALFSFSAHARSVSACGTTLTSAETALRHKVEAAGARDYRITGARMGNYTYITAQLID